MQTWEYTIKEIGNNLDTDSAKKKLNRCGSQGWELVSIVPKMVNGLTKYSGFFKRPKISYSVKLPTL